MSAQYSAVARFCGIFMSADQRQQGMKGCRDAYVTIAQPSCTAEGAYQPAASMTLYVMNSDEAHALAAFFTRLGDALKGTS